MQYYELVTERTPVNECAVDLTVQVDEKITATKARKMKAKSGKRKAGGL
jgi:hypothetical protein